MDLDNFHIQRCKSQTARTQKLDKKNRVICLVSFFDYCALVLKLPKVAHFGKFMLTSTRNLNLLEKFIYNHLKDFIMLFQKTVCF